MANCSLQLRHVKAPRLPLSVRRREQRQSHNSLSSLFWVTWLVQDAVALVLLRSCANYIRVKKVMFLKFRSAVHINLYTFIIKFLWSAVSTVAWPIPTSNPSMISEDLPLCARRTRANLGDLAKAKGFHVPGGVFKPPSNISIDGSEVSQVGFLVIHLRSINSIAFAAPF